MTMHSPSLRAAVPGKCHRYAALGRCQRATPSPLRIAAAATRRHSLGCTNSALRVREVSGLSTTPLTEQDEVVFDRQLQVRAHSLHSAGRRCQHGFPQAFVMNPLRRAGEDRLPPEGGLFRLTCPLLVKAIDEWEASGAVSELEREVEADLSGVLRAGLEAANVGHAAARRELFGRDVANALSLESRRWVREQTELVMQTGVAAQSPSKPVVKCLHAQVADHLCRFAAPNVIARRILDQLRARRVAVDGDNVCRQQCDPAVPIGAAAFWYTPAKNRWKLAKRKLRRRSPAPDPHRRRLC